MAEYATEHKVQSTYIYLDGHPRRTARTMDLGKVLLDFDASGNVIGIELTESLVPVAEVMHHN